MLRDDEQLNATLAADGIRHRARDAAHLLPGALVLLASQVFGVWAGGLKRLLPPEQVALVASGVSAALSIVLLALVVRRRAPPARLDEQERRVETASVMFLAGVGALAGGLAADFFVVTTKVTSSPSIGGLVGACVLVVVCVPWV
jgi:hypothetical protein